MAGRFKTHFDWNSAVYSHRAYTAPDGRVFSLAHLNIKTHEFSFRYRDDQGKVQKGKIDMEVRYDPHCFTRERTPDDTVPTLVFDQFNDRSSTERVFDEERYEDSLYLAKVIPHLSNKDCRESRQIGKTLYFKRKNGKGNDYGLYVVLKMRNSDGKLVMFVETAHTRFGEPYKMDLKRESETFSIILGRLLFKQWPELLTP